MVEFWMFDVAFLIIFSAYIFWFLHTRKHNLSREGLLYLYRTQLGVRAINYVGDRFKRTLYAIRYLVISVGALLMAAMLYLFGQTVSLYVTRPEITEVVKAPPVAPLIPYFPKLFGLDSFFPPFYFTYFLVALAIVAVVHEFSHGIFMRLFKIKIKSTGFVFLGPILGAFVEEEKSNFDKKKNSEQMTVLAAGVFANVVFALIFYLLYVAFFFSSFAASGYIFDTYAANSFSISSIESVGEDVGSKFVIFNKGAAELNLTRVTVFGQSYFVATDLKDSIGENSQGTIILFEDSPALQAGLDGAIVQANDIKILNQDSLLEFMKTTEPGDEVIFITETLEGPKEYSIVLTKHPQESIDHGYLGVGHVRSGDQGFVRNFLLKLMSFREPSTYYVPTWDGEFVYFIFHLLWWVMVINLLVALFNMLPLGILDGGRFFYLGALSLSGSKKFALYAYKIMAYLVGFSFLLIMAIWTLRVF